MFRECRHLMNIMEAQKDIIERHVEKHQWFQQIPDKEDAILDFIQKYGFIMREFYCSCVCKDRFECELAQQYNPREVG